MSQRSSEVVQKPKISVIIPTRNRASFITRAVGLFRAQDWANKELLILDDSDTENINVKRQTKMHQDIQYFYQTRRLTIGEKRNILASRCTGELIAHFDDDDYYSPQYLSWMFNALQKADADLVKLSGWYVLHQKSGTLGFWDTEDFTSQNHTFCGDLEVRAEQRTFSREELESFVSGYGFSYLYKKASWEKANFPNQSHGEDSIFVEKLRQNNNRIHFAHDEEAICLHIIHPSNTSRCFPNYILPKALCQKLFPNTNYFEPPGKRNEYPTVTICTLTHNREQCIYRLQRCIEKQDYPLEKIEWLILDDSQEYKHSLRISTETKIRVKYQRLPHRLSLGAKRNLSHKLCSGDYIVYMDDDDYYYPSRVRHAVEQLIEEGKEIAGSTSLLIYFSHDKTLWLSGPFGPNHATAGSFAMTREFARNHSYSSTCECNEEREFLRNYTIPMSQLSPEQTMICISHESNTFDKKRMRANGETRKMRKINNPITIKHIEEYLQ